MVYIGVITYNLLYYPNLWSVHFQRDIQPVDEGKGPKSYSWWVFPTTPVVKTNYALLWNGTVDGSLKSGGNTSWGLVVEIPIIYRVSAPSQVFVWDFSHRQYHLPFGSGWKWPIWKHKLEILYYWPLINRMTVFSQLYSLVTDWWGH